MIAINYKQVKPSRYLSAIQLVFEGGVETELFGTVGSANEELKTIKIGSSKRVRYLSLKYDSTYEPTYNGIRLLDDEEEIIIDV